MIWNIVAMLYICEQCDDGDQGDDDEEDEGDEQVEQGDDEDDEVWLKRWFYCISTSFLFNAMSNQKRQLENENTNKTNN